MKVVSRSLAILAMLALAACGGSDDTTGTGGTPPGGGTTPSATAPGISTQPGAQSVTAPAAASFSVTASGTAPLSYQWRSSINGTDWSAISGATGDSYSTGATDSSMNGRYYSVVVSNSAGSTTSNSAQLTVMTTPAGPPGPSGEFPHTANPLAITVTSAADALSIFDVGSSTDAAVQIAASGLLVGEGVTAAVGFPGNTFLEDQSLAVTAVTLSGLDSGHPLPFLSVLGAFNLAPADAAIAELQTSNLMRVSFTLTQQRLDALNGSQLVIFSARSDGSELHLVPVFANGGGSWSALTLSTSVDHLGLFGIATISGEQAAALATAWPSYSDLQLESALAPPSYELRKAALSGQAGAQAARMRPMAATARATVNSDQGDWAAQMQARLDAYYNDVVVPALNAAAAPTADLAQFYDATQKIVGWKRQRQLLGLEDERDAMLSQNMHDFLLRGLDKAMQTCTANRNGAAFAQVLGLARQAQLLGIETSVTLQQMQDSCGHSQYDVSIDWTQTHTQDFDLKNDTVPETAFTGKYRDTTTISGKLHLASTPELNGVSLDQALSYEVNCAQGAWRCAYEKYSTTAHDTDPAITRCGSGGFFASYRVERWNLDVRGHNASPVLFVSFQNSFGCAGSSFIVATGRATKTTYDVNGNTTQTTTGASDQVDTAPWSGTVRLGATSRIVRNSSPVTGQNVVPDSMQRWTTSLTFKVTELPASN